MKLLIRRFISILFVLGVIGAIVYGLLPAPLEVDLATLEHGSIRVTVDQDGKTRIREKYVVSAPLAGRLLRIELEPGDEVLHTLRLIRRDDFVYVDKASITVFTSIALTVIGVVAFALLLSGNPAI